MNDNRQSIEVHTLGLTKVFGSGIDSIELFNALELVIRRGERIAIVGSSGAGKSTLLNILGTLEKPTGGKVLYGGEDVFLWGERELANFRNRNIGFVFQFHYLLPEFNALENVMMPGLIAGLPRAEAKSGADEPSGNLDSRTGRTLHELLVSLNETLGLTMVIVTHNQELASMMHRVLRLKDAHLKEERDRVEVCSTTSI